MARTETLIDTGPLVALLDGSDQHHGWAKRKMAALPRPFYTCEAVLSETVHLVEEMPQGIPVFLNFMERSDVEVPFSYTPNAERVHALMRTYADQPMSFADACLVRFYETKRSAQVLTTDGDFYVYRTADGDALDVLAPAG